MDGTELHLREQEHGEREERELNGRKPKMRLPASDDERQLIDLAADALLLRQQWGSVAATIIERQNYLRWQAALQTTFTDEMKALLLAQAAALEPGLGTALAKQEEQAEECKRIQAERVRV